MNRSYQRGPKGVRGDRYSGSKVTNLTQFQPFWSAAEKIFHQHYREIKNRKTPLIFIKKIHEDFILPVTEQDINSTLASIPEQFIYGIKAILVPSGSRKQIKVIKSMHILGEYWNECIILHPFPKVLMTDFYAKNPNPKELYEYRRAGAEIVDKATGIEIKFDENSLRQFYLRDVLMHEIGHHNEKQEKPHRKKETFAEWFATEYGFRLWREKELLSRSSC